VAMSSRLLTLTDNRDSLKKPNPPGHLGASVPVTYIAGDEEVSIWYRAPT
jgi:hypothetical protein